MLPDGVEYRRFDGEERLATKGDPVYGEPTDGKWRLWDANRSKLASILEAGLETGLTAGATVLYLGAATGTTVSHLADFAGPTYAVEFAPRSMRELLSVADGSGRKNLFPLLKDAREPQTYAHIVESDVDVLIQDVATRGQATVARRNRQFLGDDGRLVLAIKARSEDVTATPDAVFETVLEELQESYAIEARTRLDSTHDAHLGVVATPTR
ncbi:MAG: fibrillarin-like rRNA/tRNA 2'-O-methyltransferase [Halobacteriales archaeon]